MYTALTIDEVIERAPSVGATRPQGDVSEKYVFLPTTETLETLGHMGWLPVRAEEQRLRSARHRQGFQKHVVWLRRESDVGNDNLESVVELVLQNSHDRSRGESLRAGVFRMVCSNGLIIGSTFMEPLTFQHIHINRAQVLDYVGKLGDLAMNLGKAIKPMRERKLSTFERQNYADQAMRLRYGDRVVSWPVTPAKLLEARRPTDLAKDLWTTFNVVQENVIKGGQFDHDRLDPNGRGYSATRPIVSIDRSQSLNAGLWDITSKFLNN